MPIEVTVPQLGESVTEATLTKWMVKEGDVVQKDQPLAELATDKADSVLPSPAAGRVARLLAKEGDVVPVRAAICRAPTASAHHCTAACALLAATTWSAVP